MITLEPEAILTIFVSVPLLITGGLALGYNFRSRHRSLRELIYSCAVCGQVYAFARNRPMDRCPRCGHLNEVLPGVIRSAGRRDGRE